MSAFDTVSILIGEFLDRLELTYRRIYGKTRNDHVNTLRTCGMMALEIIANSDALYHDVFEHRGIWYSRRVVTARDYAAHMRTRSAKWGTVDLNPDTYRALSRPFLGDQAGYMPGPDVPALELYSG